MQMLIDQIKIKRRVRKNLGDLKPLMESMQEYGLMNPVIVNKKNELIAGHRRLESAKLLGWKFIDVKVVDKANEFLNLALEIEENVQRIDLTNDELAEARARLEKLRNPGILRRILWAIKSFFEKLFGKD